MNRPRFITLTAMILLAAASRLIPHPWNVTAVSAMALFAGARFQKIVHAFIVTVGALFLSDLFLGFHNTLFYVYLGFSFTIFIGRALQKYNSAQFLTLASIANSLLFFLITNFGSWLVDPMYAKTSLGLLNSYIAGLPFLRNAIFGDLFYSALMFGSFSWVEKRFPLLQPAR